MVQTAEFETAFRKAMLEYPGVSQSLARQVLNKFEARLRSNQSLTFGKRSFGELIRLTLNECHVSNKKERECYAALIGFFFGRRGGQKSKQVRRTSVSPRTPPVALPAYTVTSDKNGQLTWEF